MAHLVLDKLSKVFHRSAGVETPAVCGVSLEAQKTELMVLVGPSGCGKTTLLRMIAGLEEPTAGRILLRGEVINALPPAQRNVAMVFQSQALFPHLTVRENMGLGLVLRKTPKEQIQQQVEEAARMLGLENLLERFPRQLSGGERQRTALGRALVRKPEVFLLDEPLSQLDTPLRKDLQAEIIRLQRALGTTMILVTHDQAEATAMGHRVAVMCEGKIQQVATPEEILKRPVNGLVANFFKT
jgi:ABC-type sugar transport system ATPase subunit